MYDVLTNMLDDNRLWNFIFLLLGFFLSEAWQSFRKRKDLKTIRNALKSELVALQFQLRQKCEIIDQAILALKDGRLLPTNSVRSIGIVYANNIEKLHLCLTSLERNCLYTIFERSRIVDFELERFESDYTRLVELKGDLIANQYYTRRFEDLKRSCCTTMDLVSRQLNCNPPDVFQSEKQ